MQSGAVHPNFQPDYQGQPRPQGSGGGGADPGPVTGTTIAGSVVFSLGCITSLVMGILCLSGVFGVSATIPGAICLGVPVIGMFLIAIGQSNPTVRKVFLVVFAIIAAVFSALYVPGILNLYGAKTLGWIVIGPAIGAAGLGVLGVIVFGSLACCSNCLNSSSSERGRPGPGPRNYGATSP